jgi:hypothetical protein
VSRSPTVPRFQGRRRPARPDRGARRDRRGAGQRDSAGTSCARVTSGPSDPGARRASSAARCCCSDRCSRRMGSARLRAPGRRFSRAPDDRDAPRGARGAGSAAARRAGPRDARAERPEGGVVLSRRGLGDRHRNGAPGRGRRGGPVGDSPRAMEPHVVELCEFLQAMGVGIEGRGGSTLRVHPAAKLTRRDAPPRRRLHRSRQLGRRRGDYRRAHRGHGRAVFGPRGHRLAAEAAGTRLLARQRHADRASLELTAVRRITTGCGPVSRATSSAS